MKANEAIEPTELQREALAWVRRLTSGEATTGDAEALRGWCRQSPAHAAAYAEAHALWKDLGPTGRNLRQSGIASPGLIAVDRPPRMMTRRVVLGSGLATATAAAAYAIVNPPLGLWPSLDELAADYRTATGEQRQIALGESVSVRMNTRTSLTLRPSAEAARIKLVAGEASFTSSKAEKPLIVLAGHGQVIATHARFDVRLIDAAACVTCLDGNVEVEQAEARAALKPGQQAHYGERGLEPVAMVDPDVVAAWQRGVLIFRSTPLADAVAEINRYRPGRIVLVNAALGKSLVSGRFRIDRMDDILAHIEEAFGARLQALPGGLVLLN
jgi:transmembrane sensor